VETTIFALRLVFAAILYLFLFAVVRAIYADLRASNSSPANTPSAAPAPAAPALAGPRLGRLVLLQGGPGGPIEYQLGPMNTIGRADTNNVVVPDSTVSIEHARLIWRDGSWWVEDLGSRNGVLVNGQRIIQSLPVSFGDRIRLGQAELQLLSP
jgi:hypothetical protein